MAGPEIWPRILIVDDNPIDVRMVKFALNKAGYPLEVKAVDDGLPAIAMLRQEAPYESEPLPDLVILDLNLKKIDGPEVLTVIRSTPELADIVVAILSSSPADIMKSQAAKADCFLSKSDEVAAFLRLGNKLLECYRAHAPLDRRVAAQSAGE